MTDDDLNRKVAEAMGWERMRKRSGQWYGVPPMQWYGVPPNDSYERLVHDFDSDWSLLPVMLAWLVSMGVHARIELRQGDLDPRSDGHSATARIVVPDVMQYWRSGGDIPEAVAKLVVAVREAREGSDA